MFKNGEAWQELSGILDLPSSLRKYFTFFSMLDCFNEIFSDSSKPAGNDVIGIDLGTTNSCVAVMEGKVRLFISSY